MVNAGRDVFESVNVDSIVTQIKKDVSDELYVLTYEEGKFVRTNTLPKYLLSSPFQLDLIFSKYFALVSKLELLGNSHLGDIAECESACATSDAYILKNLLINGSPELSSQQFESHYGIVNTGTLDKYVSKWGKKEMTYLKGKYLRPLVPKSIFNSTFGKSYTERAKKPKLIIKGLTLLDAFVDMKGEFVPGKTTLVVPCSDEQRLLFLAGIINSRSVLFLIKQKYASSSYNGGVTFTKGMVNNIPLPKDYEEYVPTISNLVRKILDQKKQNPDADVSALEAAINAEVYKLYHLTDAEIAIIESSTEKPQKQK